MKKPVKRRETVRLRRVLHIITTFSQGGATENTLTSVVGLKERGYDVWILAGKSAASERLLLDAARERGIRVDILDQLTRNIHPWKDLRALFALVRILREERVELVHTHSSKAGILGRLAGVLARTPLIVHTIHGLPFHEYQMRMTFHVYRWAEKICAHFSDKLISVTDTAAEKALASGVGRRDQFVTVRSGFEMADYVRPGKTSTAIRKRLGLRPTDVVIGKIARFSPLKGHKYLLEVVPRIIRVFPRARFLMIGGGELEETFRHLTRINGMERHVIFAGMVPPDEIPDYIRVMDIVVHTSLLEGLARVLPQALAAGKPVVSFDIDGAHEVVVQGRTGYLVQPKDSDMLAKRLLELLENRRQAKVFGATGRRIVKEAWTVEAMVDGIDEVYHSLFARMRAGNAS